MFSAIASLIDIFVVPANSGGMNNSHHNVREKQRSESLGHYPNSIDSAQQSRYNLHADAHVRNIIISYHIIS